LYKTKKFIEKGIIKRYTPLWLFTDSKQCYKNIKPERSITMITIQIKAVNVNKKIEIDEESFNFGILEEELYGLALVVGRRIMEHILGILDDRIREGRQRKVLENRGKEEKYLSTKMGNIHYNRRRYYDRGSGGYRYLLDEALGLEKRQTISLGRYRLEAMTGVNETSYRGAEVRMEELSGSARSHEAIRGVVLKEGERLRKAKELRLKRVYNLDDTYDGEIHDVVYIEADGTAVKGQGKDKKKGKGMEVKVGICYTGKRRRYRGGKGEAKVLENKHIHLDIESGSQFMEDMSLVAEHELGLSYAKYVVVGGDGAIWIRNGIRDSFPGGHYKLCEYHLNKRITGALSGMSSYQSRVRGLLREYDIDGALKVVWDAAKKCSDGDRFKDIINLYGYIHDNREGIRDLSKVSDELSGVHIEHTGAEENTVDKSVAHRCKKRGYRWSEFGLRCLLKVKEALLNGYWDMWWEEDRDKTIKVKIEDVEPLSAGEINKSYGKNNEIQDETTLPCFRGPHQSRPWVKALKGLIEIDSL
jgi:hypothetical protein